MSKVYLIKRIDVSASPASKYPTYEVYSTPGLVNGSGQPCIKGWLGTTNDFDLFALGEFDTVTSACEIIPDDYIVDFENGGEPDRDGLLFSFRRNVCLWDAGEWFQGLGSMVRQAGHLRIVPDTTDEELQVIANRENDLAYTEKNDEGARIVLSGTLNYLISLRDTVAAESQEAPK